MTTIPIHITPHHLRLSPTLLAFVHDKLNLLFRPVFDALAVDVVLRRHHDTSAGKRYTASARVALPGRDLHASATHASLYSAVIKLIARLARRSRKRKTRLAKSFIKRGTALTTGGNSRIVTDAMDSSPVDPALHSEVRLPRNREGGQEMRVFGFRRSLPSTVTLEVTA